jgi:hypothetical protein
MANYDSIPDDLRNTIDNLPGINDNIKNSFAELWKVMLEIAEGDVEQARPQFETFLNRIPGRNLLDSVDAEIAHLESLFGGRKRKTRKNKKSSKKKRKTRKNKKSMKRRR